MDINKEADLTDALLRMIRVAVRDLTVFEGTVTSVDEENFTCEVTVADSNSSVVFSSVPLETLIGEQASLIFIPNLNSPCVLCFRDGNAGRPQLLKVHSARVIAANPTEKWVFGKGDNGGIVLVRPLVDHMNTVEQDLNQLKDIITAWAPVNGDGGASLKVALANWLAAKITPTMERDLASKTVFQ